MPNRKRMLGTHEVADLLDMNYYTIDYWLRTGLLSCAVPAKGTGTERGFDLGDIMRIRVVQELRSKNVSLQAVREALDLLENGWDVENPLGAIVQAGGRIYYAPSERELWDVLKRQGAIKDFVLVDAEELAQEVGDKVAKLYAA